MSGASDPTACLRRPTHLARRTATRKPSATCWWCPTAPPIWATCAPCPRTHAQPRTTKSMRLPRARTPHAGCGVALYSRRMQAVLPGLLPHPQCRCAGTLSPWRPPLPCTQHGRRRGRRHARLPYRAEVLTLDPLPRRSALARSEHSPTLRERVVRSIAVMASAWREVRARAWRACNQRPQGTGHFRTLFFKVRVRAAQQL